MAFTRAELGELDFSKHSLHVPSADQTGRTDEPDEVGRSHAVNRCGGRENDATCFVRERMHGSLNSSRLGDDRRGQMSLIDKKEVQTVATDFIHQQVRTRVGDQRPLPGSRHPIDQRIR
ncbi:hypothetical protein GCM10027270_35460 [Nocardioides ginkgobilobae]